MNQEFNAVAGLCSANIVDLVESTLTYCAVEFLSRKRLTTLSWPPDQQWPDSVRSYVKTAGAYYSANKFYSLCRARFC